MGIAGGVFIFCIISFVLELFPVGITALIGGCVLILTRCISEKEAYRKMDWSAIAILGGALGFSKGLDASGAGELIAKTIINLCGGEAAAPMVIFAVIVVVSTLLSNLMSNTAVTAMLTPIGVYMAQAMGVNPLTMVIGIVIGSSLAFSTPIGTTPVTLTLAAGYRFNDYVKVGGVLNMICLIATIILIPLLYGF